MVTVTVGISYEDRVRPPMMRSNQSYAMWSRKQWDLVKRLGDQAWDEYERRFPTEG